MSDLYNSQQNMPALQREREKEGDLSATSVKNNTFFSGIFVVVVVY